tara:strand:- start:494 stop:847 length:354 start_codon:yes stop_codon:yes gene_type:complete
MNLVQLIVIDDAFPYGRLIGHHHETKTQRTKAPQAQTYPGQQLKVICISKVVTVDIQGAVPVKDYERTLYVHRNSAGLFKSVDTGQNGEPPNTPEDLDLHQREPHGLSSGDKIAPVH